MERFRVYTDVEFMHVVIPSIGYNKVKPMLDADDFLEEVASLGIDGKLPIHYAREICDAIDNAIICWEQGSGRQEAIGFCAVLIVLVGVVLWWPL